MVFVLEEDGNEWKHHHTIEQQYFAHAHSVSDENGGNLL